MRIISFINTFDGVELKQILKNSLSISSSLLSKLKKSNGISVNGKLAKVNLVCHRNDIIEITFPYYDNPSIASNDEKCTILYEDDDVICFDKPSDMPTHPSQCHRNDTLANCALAYLRKTKDEFHVVTRLDRYTSGIVLVAKNAYSASIMCTKEYNSTIHKEYEGICRGEIKVKNGTIDMPIGRCDDSIIKHCVRADGKNAKTDFSFLKNTAKGNSHIRFRLHTGRTHQIRVHMAYLGHPLLDDFLYDDYASKDCFFNLHCVSLKFIHPFSKKEITVLSKPPKNFNEK